MEPSQEQWRPVVGWEGYYEVSDLGRVRSIDRVLTRSNGKRARYRGRILKAALTGTGYPVVSLWTPTDGGSTRYLHRLVMAAFVGPLPEGMQTRHLNGERTDPRLVNLAYGTASENMLDRVRHGTHNWASRTSCEEGHEYDEWNTLWSGRPNVRRCRTCVRKKTNARRAAARARKQK